MANSIVSQFSTTWWNEICKKVKGAVVFIDTYAAECLHWNGGLLRLLDAKADSVKEFSIFESGSPQNTKAVFIVSECIQNVVLQTLRDIINASKFKHCIVITSASSSVHHFSRFGRKDDDSLVFQNLEEQLLEWMGNLNYTAEVIHCPIFTAQMSRHLFLTPPFIDLVPPTEAELDRLISLQRSLPNRGAEQKSLSSVAELEFSHLTIELQTSIRHFVTCFNQLLSSMLAREDLLSLGDFSRIIAAELESLPAARTRRKNATNKVTLIFIDRTLDMATPSSHSGETIMDRIQALLPRLPGHNSDVAVDMSVLMSKDGTSLPASAVAPGCLSHIENPCASTLLDSLIGSKQKEVLLDLHRNLIEISSRKDVIGQPRRIVADTLQKLVASFSEDPDTILEHCGVLEVALSVVQALKHPANNLYDQLLGMEKVLLQNLATEDGPKILSQITQLVRTRHERGLKIEDLIVLLVHIYALVGEDIPLDNVEEGKLRAVLAQALVDDANTLAEPLHQLIGSDINEMTVHLAVEKMFAKLQCLLAARNNLHKYKSVYKVDPLSQRAVSTGLLRQIMADFLDPSRPEIVDVEWRSSGLKDLLKSGFSRFLNVSRPHPLDSPVVIIFVVGGITAWEVHQIHDMLEATKSNTQFIVGGTRILAPRDLLSFFVTDPLHELKKI